MGRVLIKFWRLCAPHIRWYDGNPTVGISLAFMGGKIRVVILIGGINTHLNQSIPLLLHSRVLGTYPESSQVFSQTYVSFQHKKPIRGAFPHFCKFSSLSNLYFLSSKFLLLLSLSFLRPSLSLWSFLRMGRFKRLVESEEAMEKFIADYRIPNIVGLRYCKEGEWHIMRQKGEVVIPIIAFLEGGMRIPMGPVMRDYLRHFRLAPI